MITKSYNNIRRYCDAVNKKTFFITTPIFYVNASPHIGHLYTSVISDAINRYQYLKAGVGGIFCTGTDEHGTKIQQAAASKNVPLELYCTNISEEYKSLFRDCKINYTDYIRTTDIVHKVAVQRFWEELKSRGHIYSTKYSGWYCVPDETFLPESQLKDSPTNKDIKVSIESGHPVEWTEEENYMFKLGKFQNDLKHWLRDENVIKPKKYYKMLSDWISDGEFLPDVSISRPTSRVHWGVRVPEDDSQTIYVWLDALVNYLTVAGYPNVNESRFKATWPPDVQVIGKDILKFHGIYWPAFLIANGLEPPRSILCHGHWTVDGEKMSKSKHNVVAPKDRIADYTADGLRYFLLREGVCHSDGNYSDTKVLRILNSELADTLGNLLSRCTGKALNPMQEFTTLHKEEFENILNEDCVKKLLALLNELPDLTSRHYEEYNFYKVVDAVIATLHAANEFFETFKPWELKKKSATFCKLNVVLHLTMETLRTCGIILQPIIPVLSKQLLDKLKVDQDKRLWKHLLPMSFQFKEEFASRNISEDRLVLYRRIIPEKENERVSKR